MTRSVIKSTDIFELMEIKTGIQGFASMRQKAEDNSRLQCPETKLSLIYEHLPLNPQLATDLMSLELALEYELSSPINDNIHQFSENDIIISDMYLDKKDLLLIAKKNGIHVKDDHFYVSSQLGMNKHSGEIYRHLLSKINIHNHTGDNYHSDFRMAKKNNINSNFYKDELTSIEKLWLKGPERGKYIAGALRAARLESKGKKDISKSEEHIYSQILAPLLVGFVEWVLKESQAKKIKKLFFLARDGQIFYKIAKEFLKHQKIDIEISYLYASRQALHLPGFISIDDAESWILDNTSYLSLEVIADRTQIEIKKLLEISRKYLNIQCDENLSSQDRATCKEIIRDSDFIQLLTESSQNALAITKKYLAQEGVIGEFSDNLAIVDLGWSGRMQKSLENIMEKSGSVKDRLFGFYFALDQNTIDLESSRKFGYVVDPIKSNFDGNNDWIFSNKEMFEFLVAADHPSTIGYQVSSNNCITPKYRKKIEEKRKEDIGFFHESILCFAKKYLPLRNIFGEDFVSLDSFALVMVKNFILNPSRNQAQHFLGFTVSEHQIERDFKPLVNRLNMANLLKRNRNSELWIHGSVALSRMKTLYALRKFFLRILK